MRTLAAGILFAAGSIYGPSAASLIIAQEVDSSATPQDSVLLVCADLLANLRETPSWQGEVLHQIPTGSEVTYFSTSGEWSWIEYDGKNGWVLNTLLCPPPAYTDPVPTAEELNALARAPQIGETMFISDVRAPLRESPSSKGRIAVWMWVGSKVEILDTAHGWSQVIVQNAPSTGDEAFKSKWYPPSPTVYEGATPKSQRPVGWLPDSLLSRRRTDAPVFSTISNWMDSHRRAKMIGMNTGWSAEIRQKIREGKIWLGMTSDMALASWGEPSDVNRTVTAIGVTEQWVYSLGNYLYFTDGILTSWQDNQRTE